MDLAGYLQQQSGRLVNLLRVQQVDEAPITNPTMVATRYYLPRSGHCGHIKVDHRGVWVDSIVDVKRAEVSTFLLSQLDSQKLANKHLSDFQLWLPLLLVVKCLPTDPQDFRFPTLFSWFCRTTHRTYHLFSFTSVDTMGRSYTLEDLINLRAETNRANNPLPEDPELAEILRGGGGEPTGSNSRSTNCSSKPKGDSSESSEEILFKGNRDRRANREAARTTSRQMAAHDPVTTHEPTREVPPEPVREPVRETSQNAVGWKYRGRSDSEAGTSEPLQVPTGVPSQKEEGFRRFFKAVVSPTHVRVTAGGRIVPNTRGPPSPTSRRTQDNSTMDTQGIREQAPQTNLPISHMGMHQPLAVWPQLLHGYPGNLQAIQGPLSMIPMQFSPHLAPGYSFPSLVSQPMMAQPSVLQPSVPQPVTNRGAAAHSAADGTSKEANSTNAGEPHSENALSADMQDKVKITSPENFDRTKPFYFNGNLVYPVPAGFPGPMGGAMMPIQMVGLPPGVSPNMTPGMTPQFSGPMMQVSPHGSGQIIAGPFPPGTTFPGIPTIPNRIAPVNGTQLSQSQTAPPTSSIKKSEVTKKQIGTLKSSIKWCEDQLQYNRFQIDEVNMRETLKQFEAERQLFEARYQSELAKEEAAARGVARQNETVNDEGKANQISDGSMPLAEPKAAHQSDQEPDNLSKMSQLISGQSTRAQKGDLAHKQWAPVFDDKGNAHVSNSPHRQYADSVMENRKSGLPVDAALAPPFMPRGFTGEVTERSQESREAANEYFRTRPRHGSRDSTGGKLEVPYLLGALPNGVNPRTARDQDYVYNRPLTDDEVRARYLYWGKAPKSVMQGLPKFDGKHFYPPSPIKEDPAVSDDGTIAHGPLGRRPVNYDFRGTKSDCDPFRPMTPNQQYESPKAMFVSEDGYATGRHARTSSMETEIHIPTEGKAKGYQAEPTKVSAPTGVSVAGEEGNAFVPVSTNEKKSEKGALWPKLKKSTTSSALSSTTAQGYLPQYSGYAAASLSPSMNKNLVSPIRETALAKPFGCLPERLEGVPHLSPVAEKRGENLPPNPVSVVDDRLKHLPLDASKCLDVGATFGL